MRINPKDNVAVVLKPVAAGEQVVCEQLQIVAKQDIPKSHKVAVEKISKGNPIIRYGEAIALAASDIEAGQWVHTHNIKPEEE